MPAAPELRTSRLLLRQWRSDDEVALTEINAHPEVTRYLAPPAAGSSAAFIGAARLHWRVHGYGFWAVQSCEPDSADELLGFVGLGHPGLPSVIGSVELGWRPARAAWGRGLASEAATCVRDHTWEKLGIPELISLIHPDNVRSQRVAQKLGMQLGPHVHHPMLGIGVGVWSFSAPPERASAAGRSAPPD